MEVLLIHQLRAFLEYKGIAAGIEVIAVPPAYTSQTCHQILAVAKAEDCWNTTKLHHLTYYVVRASTGLKANHVCQAIRRVIDNSKATRTS